MTTIIPTDLGDELVFDTMYVEAEGYLVDADAGVTCALHGPTGTITLTVTRLGTGQYQAANHTPTITGRYVPHYTCTVGGVDRVWSGPVYVVEDKASNLQTGTYPNGYSGWSAYV